MAQKAHDLVFTDLEVQAVNCFELAESFGQPLHLDSYFLQLHSERVLFNIAIETLLAFAMTLTAEEWVLTNPKCIRDDPIEVHVNAKVKWRCEGQAVPREISVEVEQRFWAPLNIEVEHDHTERKVGNQVRYREQLVSECLVLRAEHLDTVRYDVEIDRRWQHQNVHANLRR